MAIESLRVGIESSEEEEAEEEKEWGAEVKDLQEGESEAGHPAFLEASRSKHDDTETSDGKADHGV